MRGWFVLASVAFLVGTAAADELVQSSQLDQPWMENVNKEDRKRVFQLFEEGATGFRSGTPEDSLARYEAALAIWDHPLIRFNQVVVLLRLDRIVEAADAIDKALRFGQTPFTPEMYSRLLDYKKLVGGNVGTLEVSCTHANAQMTLDGKPWFACPGTQTQRVLTGEHVVSAQQAGYAAKSQSVIVASGAPTRLDISLMTMDEAYEEHRPFPGWLPWSVIGVGAVTATVGFVVYLDAQDRMNAYDQRVAADCAVNGCDFDDPQYQYLTDLRETAEFRDQAGLFTMLAGTAVVITGAVMLYFNRPTRRLRVDVAPTDRGAMAGAHWTF